MATPDRPAQWTEITKRRASRELRRRFQDIAREAGVSDQTLWVWRKTARTVEDESDIALSAAFGWTPGSRARFFETGEPPTVADVVDYTTGPADDPVRVRYRRPTRADTNSEEDRLIARLDALSPKERAKIIETFHHMIDALGVGDGSAKR